LAPIRGHVGDGGAVGEGKIAQAGPKVPDKIFSDDAVLAQLSVMVRTRSVAVAPSRTAAGELYADNERISMETGCPTWRLGLNAAQRPSPERRVVDHRGVTVGATRVSG